MNIEANLRKMMDSCSRFESDMHTYMMELIDRLGKDDVPLDVFLDVMRITDKITNARLTITSEIGEQAIQISDQL